MKRIKRGVQENLSCKTIFGSAMLWFSPMGNNTPLSVLFRGSEVHSSCQVEFGETIVFLSAFIIFSLPPLLVGVRANLLNRKTVDLLWGHATESRAYLHKLEKEFAKLEEELKQAEEQQKESQQDWSQDRDHSFLAGLLSPVK